jgi:FlaA1/EpsC-like NDP-sugar epimerase
VVGKTGSSTAIVSATWDALARRRLAVQAVLDALAWALGIAAAVWLRYDFNFAFAPMDGPGLLVLVPLAIAAQLAAGTALGLYTGRFRYGSFEELAALCRTVVMTGAILFAFNLLVYRAIPRSSVIAAGLMAFTLMGGARYLVRLALERRLRPSPARARKVLVFGAGEAGEQVITAMLRDPAGTLLPVALLDDDPAKRQLQLKGVAVVGDRDAIASAGERLGVSVLLIAVPSADSALVRQLSERARSAGLDVLVLPPVRQLLGEDVSVDDIRPLTEADLLGRREITTDIDSIAGYLTGRRILVTGAGGSIGSELCRQIYRFAPAALVMVDRDESALHAVQLSIEGRALLDSPNIVLCDIRDRPTVLDVFRQHQPEVVFHAAALKHLPLLELYPSEAVKTNIAGTDNVLRAAVQTGVDRLVNISTDKAADPISVLGYTKRIAERMTSRVATASSGTYLSVRFGNVLGSRGSVLTSFRAQIEAGGPVTVTTPEVTRYFMTIEEAVELVIQAGAVGRDGEALVLDMGEPVRIDEVARRLIDESAKPVDVVYTGLRPGEKVHERLLGADERDRRPMHALIAHVSVPPISTDEVEELVAADGDLVDRLRALCGASAAAPHDA